ncbi:MAG: glycerophosphodiester phosphodiesterase family protein [Clostridia bacterium]|nr:glycerophosphodiester phosphodiesterase family protein [Clostridia bacterium]
MPFGQSRYADINALLNQKFAEKQVLICAHRGSWHGNVIQNTPLAYKAALMQGADIVETDTTVSVDGEVFSIHDGVEPRLFGWNRNSRKLLAEQLRSLAPLNALGEPSSHHVQPLEAVFDFLRHGELLNIDRSWRADGKVVPLLDRYPHMLKQAILKAPLSERWVLDQLDDHPVKYMFMPICYSLKDVDEVLAYQNLNTVGVELIAFTPEDELFREEAIQYIHSKGLFCWVNALTLTDVQPYKALYGGLDDDLSISETPAQGWGRLMDMGFDVIQTDWPALVKNYRTERLG